VRQVVVGVRSAVQGPVMRDGRIGGWSSGLGIQQGRVVVVLQRCDSFVSYPFVSFIAWDFLPPNEGSSLTARHRGTTMAPTNYLPPSTILQPCHSLTNQHSDSCAYTSSTHLTVSSRTPPRTNSARLVPNSSRQQMGGLQPYVFALSCMHVKLQCSTASSRLHGTFGVFVLLPACLPSDARQSPSVTSQKPLKSCYKWRLTHIGSCSKQTCHPHRAFNRRPVAS
jgi:hypothetical protein